MSVTCKYIKRIIIVSKVDTWNASQWIDALLNRFDIVDWKLLKIIIFDRDRKFLFAFWKALFLRLEVKLLYFIAYHSQFDDAFERINQIIEITLKSLILIINSKDWLTFIDALQKNFNNEATSIEMSSNQICYDFTSLISIDLLKNIEMNFSQFTRIQVKNNIAYDQMLIKKYYDDKHKSIHLKNESWALLRLHKNYNIFSIVVLSSKLSRQYIESFQILKKVENLVYKLNIFANWRVHSVFSIAQLKFIESFNADSFQRNAASFDSIFVEKDTNDVKFYEVEKIVMKRANKKRDLKYLVRWLNYDSEHDQWRNKSELKNVMNLVNDYERLSNVVTFSSSSSRRERFKQDAHNRITMHW